jgi:hypothetical protein
MVLPCRDSVGGVKKIYISSLADYESLVATVVGGDITAFTVPTEVFYQYEQLKELQVLLKQSMQAFKTEQFTMLQKFPL